MHQWKDADGTGGQVFLKRVKGLVAQSISQIISRRTGQFLQAVSQACYKERVDGLENKDPLAGDE